MQDLKISLITVAFNAEATIKGCIKSVINQSFKNIEYIIIDGGSTDNTIQIINQYKDFVSVFISEPDHGIYDAMNKGIKLARGQVIGTLNADDFFAHENVLSEVAVAFAEHGADIVYGDLDYVNEHGKILRKWRSGQFKQNLFNWGWMPPHPTFYCKRSLFEKFGFYRLDYGTAADYELMLRFMHLNRLNVHYITKVMVKMKIGGESNKNYNNRVKALYFDWRAMKKNGILIPVMTLLLKPVRKANQYF